MKRISAIILLIVYALTTSGATINFHYCMGKFIGADIGPDANETCSNCGMHKEAKKGCCNDKHAMFQFKNSEFASSINDVPANQFVFIRHQYSFFKSSFTSIDKNIIQLANSPPLLTISALDLNCNFRI